MLTHQPAVSNLETIGTDLEKAIFNGFLFSDIYGRQYSTIIEYGLAASKDANDLAISLESL